jgi:hypothetical protein
MCHCPDVGPWLAERYPQHGIDQFTFSLKIQYLLSRRCRLITSQNAARSLQSCWRGATRRFTRKKIRLSVSMLQGVIRGKSSRQRHNYMMVACIRVQSAVRGYKVRSLYGRVHCMDPLPNAFTVWILYHRYGPHSQKHIASSLSHLDIRSRASAVMLETLTKADYDGPMHSNIVGGTWLQDAFTERFLCHRCDPHSEIPSASFLPHIVHSVLFLHCDAPNIGKGRDCDTAV